MTIVTLATIARCPGRRGGVRCNAPVRGPSRTAHATHATLVTHAIMSFVMIMLITVSMAGVAYRAARLGSGGGGGFQLRDFLAHLSLVAPQEVGNIASRRTSSARTS
jgi:hypothetical protein